MGPCRSPSATAWRAGSALGRASVLRGSPSARGDIGRALGAVTAPAHEQPHAPDQDRGGDRVVEVVELVLQIVPVVGRGLAGEREPDSSTGGSRGSVRTVKRQNGIRATPAGSEMNVRMIGSIRLKKTAASPYFSNQRSAHSRCDGLDVELVPVPLERARAGRSSRRRRRSTSRRGWPRPRPRRPPRSRSVPSLTLKPAKSIVASEGTGCTCSRATISTKIPGRPRSPTTPVTQSASVSVTEASTSSVESRHRRAG